MAPRHARTAGSPSNIGAATAGPAFNLSSLRARLEGRGSENLESLERRLSLARGEIEQAHLYDYVIVNDDLDEAYDRLRGIVLAARSRRARQQTRLQEISARFRL